jgi:hypothetical protein|tara:strand:+ start:4418 stop:4606 length:189 start_codon:yes stop_codon:yes gene_type:complete
MEGLTILFLWIILLLFMVLSITVYFIRKDIKDIQIGVDYIYENQNKVDYIYNRVKKAKQKTK